MQQIKVLFVCKGNICRSPTAHGVFRSLVKQADLEDTIHIASVGTESRMWGHEGGVADARSVATAALYDCDFSDLISEQFEVKHLDYDYIIAMDNENVQSMKSLFPNIDSSKVSRMLDYAPTVALKDVPDPYYQNNFEKVYLMIDTACHNLLAHIKKEHNL